MSGALPGGVRCAWMRGGTSKGLYLLRDDLPTDPGERDDLLLRLMGTPDPRQVDGLGGATSLTSKVAVVGPAADPDADVDYLFLQLGVDEPTVSDRQTCGNLLAGVGAFAVLRGLVPPGPELTRVRVRLRNGGGLAVAELPTPGGVPRFDGDVAVDGVPGTAAGVTLAFEGTAGSSTGALLPTGRRRERIAGIDASCVDNGMPVVVVRAADLGLVGDETAAELAADAALAARVDALRTEAGRRMGLGDVSGAPVPKTVALAPPKHGGDVAARSFIPVRPHAAIGVLAAVSAVTAASLPGCVGDDLLGGRSGRTDVEHPGGHLLVDVDVTDGDPPAVHRAAVVRTARLLMDGTAYPRGA